MDLISLYYSPRLNELTTFKIFYSDKSFNILGWELIVDGKRNRTRNVGKLDEGFSV